MLGTPNGGKPPNWVTRLLRDPAVREAIVKGMRQYLTENFSMSQLIQ